MKPCVPPRRFLAARLVHADRDEAVCARDDHLPCVIKDVGDHDPFADALLDNLARTDLTRAQWLDSCVCIEQWTVLW